jgi:hypothetical protein
MTDKPTLTPDQIMWKLVSNSEYHLVSFIDDEPEENFPEVMKGVLEDKSQMPALLNSLLYYMNEAEGLEKAILEEITVLQERKARFKRRSERIRDFIKCAFERFGLTKLEAPLGTISKVTRKASKLIITDEGALITDFPELYIRQEPKLDKTALKKLLEDGEEIDGAELVDITTIMIRR